MLRRHPAQRGPAATSICWWNSRRTPDPTLFDVAAMERELSGLLGGRCAELRTSGDVSRDLRDEIIESAGVRFAP